jgi:hypothetical protein
MRDPQISFICFLLSYYRQRPGIKSRFCWISRVTDLVDEPMMMRLTPSVLQLPVAEGSQSPQPSSSDSQGTSEQPTFSDSQGVSQPCSIAAAVKVGGFGIATFRGVACGKRLPPVKQFLCIVKEVTDEDVKVEHLLASTSRKFHSQQLKEVVWISRADVVMVKESPSLDHHGHYIFLTPPLH